MMILTVKDRLFMAQHLIPKQGDMLTMAIARELIEKINMTSEELEAVNFKSNGGSAAWDKNEEYEIEVTTPELKLIKDQIKLLDQKKEISLDLYPTCLKFEELKEEKKGRG